MTESTIIYSKNKETDYKTLFNFKEVEAILGPKKRTNQIEKPKNKKKR